MDEFNTQLQNCLRHVPGEYLLILGVLVLVFAFPVWLAGVRFARFGAFAVVSVAGGVAYWYLQPDLITFSAVLVISLAAAVIFCRKFFLILLAILICAGFACCKVPFEIPSSDLPNISSPEPDQLPEWDVFSANLHSLAKTAFDASDNYLNGLAVGLKIQCALIALGIIVAGFIFSGSATALSMSALGTILIFIGGSLVLLFKPASPADILKENPQQYRLVFLGMILFGFLSQLLFCSHCRAQSTDSSAKDSSDGDE